MAEVEALRMVAEVKLQVIIVGAIAKMVNSIMLVRITPSSTTSSTTEVYITGIKMKTKQQG